MSAAGRSAWALREGVKNTMPRVRRIAAWTIPPLLGLAAWGLLAGAAALARQAPAAPFVYRTGPQGVGFYAAPAASPGRVVANAPAPAARPRTVGPGARNFSTGNRVPLHRPWLRAR
jgi:hypothetical protein